MRLIANLTEKGELAPRVIISRDVLKGNPSQTVGVTGHMGGDVPSDGGTAYSKTDASMGK